jgi:hypothetical protein
MALPPGQLTHIDGSPPSPAPAPPTSTPAMLRHRNMPAQLALALVSLVIVAYRAEATLPFQRAFIREYVADNPNREYAQFVKRKAKCNVCHQGTKDRTQLNVYGAQLAKLLDYRTDNHNEAKIVAALREVANLPCDPSRTDCATFGERIAAGELPAGNLENLRRNPGE